MGQQQIQLLWMRGRDQGSKCVTFGVPWAKGAHSPDTAFKLIDSSGCEFPVQTAVSAKWPDGSVKWTRHSANLNGSAKGALRLNVIGQEEALSELAVKTGNTITVDTGSVRAIFGCSGKKLICRLDQENRTVCSGGVAVAAIERSDGLTTTVIPLEGIIDSAVVEQNGPLHCVIKLIGKHAAESGETYFPFHIRFYLYRGSPEIRVTHTFFYDGDARRDFIRGLGLRFEVPMEGELYNRHIKLAGDKGFFHEALQLLTSWRPRIDTALYIGQMAGSEITENENTEQSPLPEALENITLWDSYKLVQDSSEHFVIRKRTGSESCAFINAAHGARSNGVAYAGSHKQGFCAGLRNFWQKYPSALWVEGMSRDTATMTVWMWSPDAPAGDLRHYDTKAHAGAYYEGFDEIRSTPYGIANTSELVLSGHTGGIMDNVELTRFVASTQSPAVITASPEYMYGVRAFGTWSLPHSDTAGGRWFERQLECAIAYYLKEIEQRKWFGFFDYGDFMHTYDPVRHTWRYDMGGYAWQNTELVPTLWLWLAFLRTGREDIFTLAEAMCRHTAEVDSYHFGQYKGLGSRHNVIHWGCSCKEARIAMAGHHRYYYYLTGDMRTGDVLDDVADAEYGLEQLDPLRFSYDDGNPTHARTGPDWSSLCSNWMTAWERHGSTICRDKLLRGISDIKKAPLRLISGSVYGFVPDTGQMIYIGEGSGGSHLAICMGSPQIWMEMADIIDDPEWEEMMAEYGSFYLLSSEEKHLRSGGLLSGRGFAFPYMASAMVAYYAGKKKDQGCARRVWNILRESWASLEFENREIPDPLSAFAGTEVPRISTNFIAQWCLNVIMCLELIGHELGNDTL